jgi:hypothetical protein
MKVQAVRPIMMPKFEYLITPEKSNDEKVHKWKKE